MKKIIFILILVIILSSCASYTGENLKRYIGFTNDELIIDYGIPDSEKMLDSGDKLIEYVKSRTVYGATTTGYIRFILKDNIVIDYSFNQEVPISGW